MATIVIWLVSALISLPPLFPWSNSPQELTPKGAFNGGFEERDNMSCNGSFETNTSDYAKCVIRGNHEREVGRDENLKISSLILKSFKIGTSNGSIRADKRGNYLAKLENSTLKMGIVKVVNDHLKPLTPPNHRKSVFDSHELTCQLSAEPRYVVYSAMGSFYIPLIIMIFAYFKVYTATKARLRKRAKMGKKLLMNVKKQEGDHSGKIQIQKESVDNEETKEEIKRNENLKSGESIYRNECDVVQDVAVKSVEFEMLENHISSKLNATCSKTIKKLPLEQMCAVVGEAKITSRHHLGVHSSSKQPQQPDFSSITIIPKSIPSHNEQSKNHTIETTENKSNSHSYKTKPQRFKTTKMFTSLRHQKFSKAVFKRQQIHETDHTSVDSTSTNNKTSSSTFGYLSRFLEEKQRISLSLERRAAQTMAVIMGAFVVCWLPFFVYYVFNPLCSTCQHSSLLMNLFVWLGYINSTINPIIYTIFNIDFRRSFKRILQGSCLINYI